MEKKYADRLSWKRVTEREFQIKRMDQSIVTCLWIHKVREPLYVTYEKKHCIADSGFKWFQVFQEGLSYVITIVVNDHEDLVQYYYDLCLEQGFDDNRQSPWYLDAYLDVVCLPNGDMFILDENELQDACYKGIITWEQELKLQDITNQLIRDIKAKREPLMKLFEETRGNT